MKIVFWVGIVMVALGALLLVVDFLTLVKKKLTDGYGLIWGMIGLLLLVAGSMLLKEKQAVVVAVILLGLVLFFVLFSLTREVSVLMMKNQELAMQVSLLNHENESILQALEQLRETEEG